MRELTEKEKAIVTALVQKYQPNSTLKIGEILMELYPIKAMRKCEPSESDLKCFSEKELQQVKVEYVYDSQKDFCVEFYEAILLICYLIDKNYLIINYFPFTDKTLGEFSEMMHSDGYRTEIQNFFDVFPYKIWLLLNGTFIVTNALIDYAKDFKTIEQRRFEQQMIDTQKKHSKAMCIANFTLFVACLALIVTLIPVVKQCSNNDLSIRELNQTIKEIDIPDAFNAKLSNDTIKAIIINQPKTDSNKSIKEQSLQK